MIKKSITYKDLDGNPVTEDWYFHYREDELIEMQVETNIADKFQAIVDGKADSKQAIGLIKLLLQSAVGKRSSDGRKFEKSDAILEDFTQTGAYSALLLELVGDPAGAAVFINSLMPADMENTVNGLLETQKTSSKKAVNLVELPSNDDGSPKDPKDMSREELIQAMRAKQAK